MSNSQDEAPFVEYRISVSLMPVCACCSLIDVDQEKVILKKSGIDRVSIVKDISIIY